MVRADDGNSSGLASWDDPRWIVIRISRIHLAVTLLGAVLACSTLFLVPMSTSLRAVLLIAFLAATLLDLLLALLRGPQSVTAFYLFDIDQRAREGTPPEVEVPLGLRLRRRRPAASIAEADVDGRVLAGSFVSPWFTALRYRMPHDPVWRRWWPRVIPLWPDSLPPDEFRRLRVALRWK